MPNFLDYIRENSTLDLSDDVDKDLSVGDVHVASAGGDGKKKKKKPSAAAPEISVAYNAKSFEDRMFGEDNTGNAAVDYFNSEMAKLKLKQKVTLDCEPNELARLLDENPELKATLAQIINQAPLKLSVGKAGPDDEARDDHGKWTSGGGGGKQQYDVLVHNGYTYEHAGTVHAGSVAEARAAWKQHGSPSQTSKFRVSLRSVGKAATRQVLLMRHGATHLNDDDTSVDRIRGWKNVPLSEEGKEEAAKLGEKVAKDPPDNLVSSDLKRAADTAKMVAAACDLKMKKSDFREGLRPWDVGKFAGQSSKKAVPILCDYAINKPDEVVPEGESFNEFYSRFTSELAAALKDYPDGVLGVVSHHRNERMLKASEKAGWKAGKIDGKEFSKKGEGTAGFEIIDIPQAWLDGVAGGSKVTKWVNADFDISRIWQENVAKHVEDDDVSKEFTVEIKKVDAEQQIFYGWAYVSEEHGQIVIDKQDDYILPADLLKAAEDFTLHGGKLGDMHDARNVGRVVASFVTTEELCKAFGLATEANRRGWILGFKVDDPQVWAKIKSGDQIELSIGGRGERVER